MAELDDFSADSVRGYIRRQREQAAAEQRAFDEAAKAQQDRLREDFMQREVQPEAMARIATLVHRMVDRGEKQALLFQFPSDWLPDSGRAITSRDPAWHLKLDGFARRAYDFYEKELAPRGFQLRAQIVDWPGGMPGDVGFFLTWKAAEEL